MKKNMFGAWGLGLGAAIILSGCGGGGGDSDSGSTHAPASLTTTNDVAKAAAAVLVAYHVNKGAYYLAGEDVFDPVSTYACSSGGNYTIGNKSTPDSEDGTVQYSNCKKSANKVITGRMVVTCPNAECDPTLTSAYELAHQDTLAGGLKFNIGGSYRWDGTTASPSILEKDTWKGKIDFQRSGLNSSMDLLSGLVSDVYGGGLRSISGALYLTGGNAHNCLDGEFAYRSTSHLNILFGSPFAGNPFAGNKTTAGKLEFSANGAVAGTATFKADGSVRIEMAGAGAPVDIPLTQFEGYCNMKEAFALLR